MNRQNLSRRFLAELEKAEQAERQNDLDAAFAHLERAHILGQRWLTRHWTTHWRMLKIARKRRDRTEISGQIRRLAATPLGWALGWVPKGNTGGANVHPLKPMPLPEDMVADLDGFSVRRDVLWRIAIVLLLGTVIAAFAFVSSVRAANGENLVIASDASQHCQLIEGMPGAEDILLEAALPTAFAIGGDRRSFRAGGPGRGKVFAFDPSDPVGARELEVPLPDSLRSFGGDLHIDSEGVLRLFLANRGDPRHSIEIYRVDGETGKERLIHERSLTADGFINPNDVHALSSSSAVVTLDKSSSAGTFAEIWEGARRSPSGRVAHINSDGMKIVADGLLSSNGIELSHDGREAYVGELVGRAVSMYAINETGEWRRTKRISLPFAVDNLTLRDDGKLIVAGHPKLLTLAQGYQFDEAAHSPSQVTLLDPQDGEQATLMQDSGAFFSGSSVGVMDGTGKLFVGTAFGPGILRCIPR